MNTISNEQAIAFFRKSYDELKENGSILLDTDSDSNNLDEIIRRTLPEAINEVHRAAPANLLEGKSVDFYDHLSTSGSKVLTIDPGVADFLRLIKFKATDSAYAIDDVIAENGTEGRMQLNPYTRATHDNPALVIITSPVFVPETQEGGTISYEKIDATPTRPVFKYYQLASVPASDNYGVLDNLISVFEYVSMQEYKDSNDGTTYEISDALKESALNYLVGLVLITLKEVDLGQIFLKRTGLIAQTNG